MGVISKFEKIENELKIKGKIDIKLDKMKPYKWLALINAAILLTILVLSGGASDWGVIFLIIVIGSTVPFVMLYMSKWLAIKSHKIRVLTESTIDNDSEKDLFRIIKMLSTRAGLDKVPDIGIYESDDINAFATGRNKENSLIAFSSKLMIEMDEDAIAAVAAHELAHIANGDMITMTIVQAIVNFIVIIVTVPINMVVRFAFSKNSGWLNTIIVWVVQFIVISIMLFLANLIVNAFSRKREFEADKLASTILDTKRMIHALESLNAQGNISFQSEQESYASFKICSPPAFLDIFSTHPTITRRIAALQKFESTQNA